MEQAIGDESSVSKDDVGFASLGLLDEVVRAVEDKGYHTPSPIQAEAIPLVLQGRDIMGASQTGSGKTAAFALPVLSMLKNHGKLRCLIIEPTRELAQQVDVALQEYSKYLTVRVTLLHGGVGYGRQYEQLKRGTDIVVATPGRLLDHISQGTISLKHLQVVILDEADRMLDMGFIPDVRKIVGRCPHTRQSMLFSATMPPKIERLSGWMLNDPASVAIGSGTSAADTITHAIYPVDDRQKFDLLVAILKNIDYHSVIIFSRTKAGADMIARWLKATDHNVVILHSDRTQKERDRALKQFKSGEVEILVATDIVSRGIDIAAVSHVINYDMPQHCEDYVHRIGRTGRMNNEGDAVTFYTAGDGEFLRSIENFIGQPLDRKTIDDFEYKWSPVLDEKKSAPKRRNRGFSGSSGGGGKRGRRR